MRARWSPVIVLVVFLADQLRAAELVLLLAIWRHGDRAPGQLPYPNDQNSIDAWPRGWDQLTNLGMKRSYELGTFLRSRYAGRLFSKQFDHKQVFIQSSDSERAIESAQTVMAGLFPAEDNRVWNTSTGWQPIPIHTNGYGREDPLLKPTSYDCPLYRHVRDSDVRRLAKKMDKRYGPLFDWLSVETKLNVSFMNVKKLADVDIEITHRLPQPDWVNTVWEGVPVMRIIRELRRRGRLEEYNNLQKAKLRSGLLVDDWLKRIEAADIEKKGPKAVFYSSHDGTLTPLLYALGVSNDLLVPPAACIFVEIVRDPSSDLYAQIFYRNTSSHDPWLLRLPNCSAECPVADFITQLQPMRIGNEKALRQICNASSITNLMVIALLIVAFLALK